MKFLQPISVRLFYTLLLTLGLVWIWLSAVPASTVMNGRISSPQSGFQAPDFTLNTIDGQNIKLSDLRGKAVIVNFWASWCPPCRTEMPALERVYQRYKNNGLVILAVNSTVQDSRKTAQDFVSQNNLNFPVPLDDSGLVTRLYRVQSLPTTFFINADGVIDEIVIGGPMAEALLISRVEKALRMLP